MYQESITENFMGRVRHALSLPVRQRCAELTVLFDRGSRQELHNFFPVLIESIFGPQGTVSWGLRSISEMSNDDYVQLQHFLSPCGPLFKLIYMLLKDPAAKYDFSVTFLPSKVRQVIQSSHLHPFYADLIHINQQTKQIMSLLLNPFDYYMFHFAYHLINPWHQRTNVTNMTVNWNTVFYALSYDYIFHFLQIDPSVQVQPIICYSGKTPVQPIQEFKSFRPPITCQLINSNILNKTMEDYKFHQSLDRHPRNEIWRSETVLTVFIDMWLNNDQISSSSITLNNMSNTSFSSSTKFIQYNELPTGEYMRIIRVLTKHIHAFTMSAKADDTHMSELKKIALPMLQGKFYIFLRNLIHRWPLDGSFRLVLELWLTYIQPWRYTPSTILKYLNKNEVNPDADDINIAPMKSVERDFLPFIAENLLAYVVIFQQLLPRFGRVDLVSPKMAVMLYRITKVFDQPNLALYLREVEQCVENNHSPSHSYHANWTSNLPPLSPTSNWSRNTDNSYIESPSKQNFSPELNSTAFVHVEKKWSAIVRQKIYELEGPNFCYKPLFSQPPAPEVYDLIYQMKNSIRIARDLVDIKKSEETQRHSGFFGFFRGLFESPSLNDEFTLNERMKVPPYLDCSLQNILDMFQISEVQERVELPVLSVSGSGIEFSDDFKFLTPEKVRERAKRITYEGDPDLLPIQSNEVKFLVRTLYQTALKINEECGQNFRNLYYQDSYFSRLLRQILQPPRTVYYYDKTKLGSPRLSRELPPRISLRYFSRYKFLTYFVFGAMIFIYGFGYNFGTYLILLIFGYILYICMKAIPRSSVRLNYPTEGFGNISFNDRSF